MTKAAFFILLLLLMTVPIYCINHMDLIQTMTGEFAGCEFGYSMASLDFNADGYDDLVVCSSAWNPNGVYNEQQLFGKLYFYWGGLNFDNIPDMIISGEYHGNYYGHGLFNAGDINGDSIDDLIISNRDSINISKIEIFYGRQIPHSSPDFILSYPISLTTGLYAVPLGDINGDNHSDLGLSFTGDEDLRVGRRLLILTDTSQPPYLFYETNNYIGTPLLSGVGDVNNDGFDDIFMHLPIDGLGDTDMRLVLYYGGSTFPVIDSLVISDNTHEVVTSWGSPVGDVNGDGFDDFVAYNYLLWLGNTNLSANLNMLLDTIYGYSESGDLYPFLHGDFNNDGFDDIVCTNHIYGGWSGVANIWMGRSQMNGTLDLHLFPPSNYIDRNFGWAKATGDFNGDGFCDLAISAPWWGVGGSQNNQLGKVFVYSGNAELADTTVGNEDDTIPLDNASSRKINVFPNPFRQFTALSYTLDKDAEIVLNICNLKGQRVKTISKKRVSKGEQTEYWDGSDDTGKACSTGIYIVKLVINGKLTSSGKVIIVR